MRRLLIILFFSVSAFATPVLYPSPPGHYVPFGKLSSCPKIDHRPYPTSAADVRPDDFKVVIGLGDSITAALFAKGSRNDVEEISIFNIPPESLQKPFLADTPDLKSDELNPYGKPLFPFLSGFVEDRGVSYASGGDDGAITIPNIISYYAGNTTGSSKGSHPPVTCLSGFCTSHPEGDGLNGAISGSLSANLLAQVTDYIVPQIQAMGIPKDDWKYVNLGIGANDVCAYCLSPNMTSTAVPLTGSPEQFATGIKAAVEHLRDNVPNIIVNIIGMFRVSDIYALSLKGSTCSGPILPPVIPHLPVACSCAFIPGPAGDFTRRKMDELGEAYDNAVWEVISYWHDEQKKIETERVGGGFGVTWQPGTVVDLANYPSEALSSVDCFHPSLLAHQRMAAGIWSRLTLPLAQRSIPIKWEDEVYVRCLEEEDRIKLWLQ